VWTDVALVDFIVCRAARHAIDLGHIAFLAVKGQTTDLAMKVRTLVNAHFLWVIPYRLVKHFNFSKKELRPFIF
jgi:hypothetical protein